MSNWIEISDPPIQADIIRWIEPVYHYPKRKKAKPSKIGTREVTAEVLKVEGVFVQLLVKACTLKSEDGYRKVEVLKTDTVVNRKMPTLMRNTPERLLWSDETARVSVMADAGF